MRKQDTIRTFRSVYGVGPPVVSKAWNLIDKSKIASSGANIEYFLWSLVFMKNYGNEQSNCAIVGGTTRKTFRKWVWQYIFALEKCFDEVVSKNKRYIYLRLTNYYVTFFLY